MLTSDASYILHVVEAQRGASAGVFQGLSGEGLIVAMDEAVIKPNSKTLR